MNLYVFVKKKFYKKITYFLLIIILLFKVYTSSRGIYIFLDLLCRQLIF